MKIKNVTFSKNDKDGVRIFLKNANEYRVFPGFRHQVENSSIATTLIELDLF